MDRQVVFRANVLGRLENRFCGPPWVYRDRYFRLLWQSDAIDGPMRALLQRVSEASVEVDGKIISEVGAGFDLIYGWR